MLIALTKIFLNTDVDLDKVAAMTPGFLACDIAQLVEMASSYTKEASMQEQVEP